MEHEDHDKQCKKFQWGKSTGEVKVKGQEIKHYLADVDLWYCNDCKVYFYHDWGLDEYNDLTAATKEQKLKLKELVNGVA